MRHVQKSSADTAESVTGGEVEVPVLLMQRGRPPKETTARMSYGMAMRMMEGKGEVK